MWTKAKDFEGFRKNWMIGGGSMTQGGGDGRLQAKVIGLGGQVPRIALADPGHEGLSQEFAGRESKEPVNHNFRKPDRAVAWLCTTSVPKKPNVN